MTQLPSDQPSSSTPRRRSGRHVAAIVFGAFLLLPGLGLLAGGTGLAIAKAAATDDDGYFAFSIDPVETDGIAVRSDEQWFDDEPDEDIPWVLDWLDVDLRVRADAAGAQEVFVGVARMADIDAYLADHPHSVVTDIEDHTAVYRLEPGSQLAERRVAPPATQDFWLATASGAGEQELVWDTRGGRWSVVIMHADGSPGVVADVEIGARSGALTPIIVTLFVVGGLVTLAGLGLIVFGGRGRRDPEPVWFEHPRTPLPPPPVPTAANEHSEPLSIG